MASAEYQELPDYTEPDTTRIFARGDSPRFRPLSRSMRAANKKIKAARTVSAPHRTRLGAWTCAAIAAIITRAAGLPVRAPLPRSPAL